MVSGISETNASLTISIGDNSLPTKKIDQQNNMLVDNLAALPAVDKLLNHAAVIQWRKKHGQTIVVQAIRNTLSELRKKFQKKQLTQSDLEPLNLIIQIKKQLKHLLSSNLQSVINLSGTVLHTNLGRALLPDEAVNAVVQVMRYPVNLEFNLSAGTRGDRDDLIHTLLCDLTGAQAATIVNNNAAAVFLLLNTLAKGKEVVVSRGELVEIGGSFRIPDIMSRAGVRLHEVGTTNRTHLYDYEQAVNEHTALFMKVHCSNYEIKGFTKAVALPHLAQLGKQHDIPVAVDLGSGTLIPMEHYGLPAEPTVQQSLQQGAQVVSFSGDKLLGGPQAGILVGDSALINQIKRHPLKRMLRVDKMTLAALEAVLRLYKQPEHLSQRLTTLRLLTRKANEIKIQAKNWLPSFQQWAGQDFSVCITPMSSQIGSGALPIEALPSYGLCFKYQGKGNLNFSVRRLEKQLRQLPYPVIGRIQQQKLYLDFRCLQDNEEKLLYQNFQQNNLIK